MARHLRVEFEDAIQHAMALGNGEPFRFHAEDDSRRMDSGLKQTVARVKRLVEKLRQPDQVRQAHRLFLTVRKVIDAVARY